MALLPVLQVSREGGQIPLVCSEARQCQKLFPVLEVVDAAKLENRPKVWLELFEFLVIVFGNARKSLDEALGDDRLELLQELVRL